MHKLLATVALGALAAVSVPGVASAQGGTTVTSKGNCSGASTSVLKAKPDNGQIEVQFQVDENVVGDTWRVAVRDNGTVVARGKKTTVAPSGSFEFRRRIADLPGTDDIQAKATNLTTGETCRASLSI
jgi:hypothetical protein